MCVHWKLSDLVIFYCTCWLAANRAEKHFSIWWFWRTAGLSRFINCMIMFPLHMMKITAFSFICTTNSKVRFFSSWHIWIPLNFSRLQIEGSFLYPVADWMTDWQHSARGRRWQASWFWWTGSRHTAESDDWLTDCLDDWLTALNKRKKMTSFMVPKDRKQTDSGIRLLTGWLTDCH